LKGERDGFAGFERGREIWGWGRPWKTVGRRKETVGRRIRENLDLIVCGRIYGFICKMLRWHFLIGGCKTGFYISSLLNSISRRKCIYKI
jgi:hypothetical protein